MSALQEIIGLIEQGRRAVAVNRLRRTHLSTDDRNAVLDACVRHDAPIVADLALGEHRIEGVEPHPLLDALHAGSAAVANLLLRRPDTPTDVLRRAKAIAPDEWLVEQLDDEIVRRQLARRRASAPSMDEQLAERIFEALGDGDTAPLERALDQGLDPNSLIGSDSLLSLMMWGPQLAGAAMLLRRGASVSAPANEELLSQTAGMGSAAGVALLLKHGADPNSEDGRAAVAGAIRSLNPLPTLRVLLREGADPDGTVEGRSRPMTLAAEAGRPDLVELLLEHGAKDSLELRMTAFYNEPAAKRLRRTTNGLVTGLGLRQGPLGDADE